MASILIAGPGAVGGFFGWKLATRHDVTLLGKGRHASALQLNGLTVHSGGVSYNLALPVVFRAKDVAAPDLCIVAVKNAALEALVYELCQENWYETVFLSLMNGIEADEKVAETFGETRCLRGFCQLGAEVIAPGVIEHRSLGKVFLGKWPSMADTVFRKWVALFEESGIECAAPEDFDRARWLKFAWNAVFNTLSAHYGVTTDVLLDTPALRQEVDALYAEVVLAATAVGVNLTTNDYSAVIEGTRRHGAFIPSSLQDARKGKPLETAFFLKSLSRIGEAARLDLPIVKRLLRQEFQS
jgi:2-dehydropantoate 2-reductase